ncbi:flagellar WD repeat-containing protein [Acrasis kona]|uniref:Flagellar WD repeat-containing protein n=1 Tax=Acrasis kona TaxID=1008807 RepID=A0AAW2ZCT9_9EUKA
MSGVKLPDINKNGVITRADLKAQISQDDDEDEQFEEVSDADEDEEFKSDEEGDFELEKLIQRSKKEDEEEKISIKKSSPRPTLNKNPEVIDDFILNFLKAKGLNRSLDVFQEELYEHKQLKNKGDDFNMVVPDVYHQIRFLEDQKTYLETQLNKEDAVGTLQKMRDEKEFHKRSHMRLKQELKEVHKALKQYKKHTEKYDPVLNELRRKLEKAIKDKALVELSRTKLEAKMNAMNLQNTNNGSTTNTDKDSTINKTKKTSTMNTDASTATRKKTDSDPRDSRLPPDNRPNPNRTNPIQPPSVDAMTVSDHYEGHTMAISSIAIHPSSPIVATASDDMTWKMYSLKDGKIFLSGEGHNDWIGGIDFHPQGAHLCTSSGDGTAKLWDLINAKCVLTFTDHTHAVWSCIFNETGDFVVTSSLDQTARLWDLNSDRCRTTFRAHKDSVNHAMFVPYTNNVITCSADKTAQLWDIRLDANGNSTQTLFGHENALNHVAIDPQSEKIATSDYDGKVFLWDMRRLEVPIGKINASEGHSAQKMCFDPSGKFLAVACEDNAVRIFSTTSANLTKVNDLNHHKDGVLDVKFDPDGKYMVSCGSDCVFVLYQ